MDSNLFKLPTIKTKEKIAETPILFSKVVVEKVDLDTIGSYFIHQINGNIPKDVEIIVKKGQASQAELSDKNTLCIECGGSGLIKLGNFDHHAEGIEQSATLQTLKTINKDRLSLELIQLANYIDDLDLLGVEKFYEKHPKPIFPGLNDIISGVNLIHGRDPVKVLQEGSYVLKQIFETQTNPFGQINGFERYALAKKINDEAIDKVRSNIQFVESNKGIKIGYLMTEYFGATSVAYQEGIKKYGSNETIAVVAHNPKFGPNKNENKFTVGLNLSPAEANQKNIKLSELAKKLNEIDLSTDSSQEKTWGGPATGTIIGSPKGGSSLDITQVLEMFKNNY